MYCLYKLDARTFEFFKEHPEAEEKILNNIKNDLIHKAFFCESKVDFDKNYSFAFSKKNWSELRIDEEIDLNYSIVNGLYKGMNGNVFSSRSEVKEDLKKMNPFDILLEFFCTPCNIQSHVIKIGEEDEL